MYNTPLSNVVDFVATLSYEYVEVDAPAFDSVDDNGFGLGLGGWYYFAPSFALGLNASFADDATGYSLAGRFFFGQ